MQLRFQKTSVVEQVARAIREEITSGKCRGWLPTERALCEQVRVSRRTLRCALDQLKRQGLVSARVGVGTEVLREIKAAATVPAGGDSVGLLMPEPIDVLPAVVLRPRMFIERDALRDGLAADPGGFLSENDGSPHPHRRQRCGHAAQAGADDEHLGSILAARGSRSRRGRRV